MTEVVITKLWNIYAVIKKYAEDEVLLQNEANLELRAALTKRYSEFSDEIKKLATLKAELLFCKNNIRYYFNKMQEGLDYNTKITELNEWYKTAEVRFKDDFATLDNNCNLHVQPWAGLVTSILSDMKLETILDVVRHYNLMNAGQLSYNQCVSHGISITEKDGKYPKGLFDNLIRK